MPRYRHKRTGRISDVPDSDAFRFNNARYELVEPLKFKPIEVPSGTVAELLDWAGEDDQLREALLRSEKAGKNRKGIIEALS